MLKSLWRQFEVSLDTFFGTHASPNPRAYITTSERPHIRMIRDMTLYALHQEGPPSEDANGLIVEQVGPDEPNLRGTSSPLKGTTSLGLPYNLFPVLGYFADFITFT